MTEENLMKLGLKRPAAKLLIYMLENPGPKTQADIVLSGTLKQPYISVTSKELREWGFLITEEVPKRRSAYIKRYSLIPVEDIKAKFMQVIRQDYDRKMAAVSSF